jgi:hypothetical protein
LLANGRKNRAARVHPHGEGLSLHYIKTMEAMTTAGVFVIRLSLKALKPVAKAC